MKREKVVLNGQPVGRIKAGWLLFTEAFRFMWADKEMLWVPIISFFMNIFLLGLVIAGLLFAAVTLSEEFIDEYPVGYAFIFLIYVVGAFTLAFTQAAIAHMVYVRAHGGDATLGEGLKKALSHWWGLLAWSIITSTVGLILRIISERSKLLGNLVALFLGAAWGILTYFVVPAIVIDNHGPFPSIKKSAQTFKATWGEALVSNISFGLIFLLAHLLVILSLGSIVVFGIVLEFLPLIIFAAVLFVVWIFVFALVSSSVAAVIRTLLYIYASEGTIPQNFNRELLEKMLAGKREHTPQNQNPEGTENRANEVDYSNSDTPTPQSHT